MNPKDMTLDALEAALVKVGTQQIALRQQAAALNDELNFRAQLAAIEKATGAPVGKAMAATLRANAEAECKAAAEARLAEKRANKEAARAMTAAWETVRDEALAKGEPAPNKDAWERQYLAAQA